ncbi:Prophage CP4-57 regulatory [Rhodomicrobium vannielii ATCC 17100]|uniref:Prophage CP4-57 regulatory n=1 Tax=Rhodomicrobium vannielii (strain ATCC 17100 / DSM 162 / LMG 4299 / NCIMB 10020 / ATH 3.1.1) TaxID=648757 RepID=E3I104_RHOVT|nr:AlpA family phage regulatory protein [Rhodomicrobium vannielii]ADP72327.1 Prophage CP4-57 regulatory [Rhodomicrobium vannielii ATCC 17100]
MLVLLRRDDVRARLGCSVSNLYSQMAAGMFPRPIKLGPKYSAWPEYEVEAIIKSRVALYTDEQVKKLVRDLTANRTVIMK